MLFLFYFTMVGKGGAGTCQLEKRAVHYVGEKIIVG